MSATNSSHSSLSEGKNLLKKDKANYEALQMDPKIVDDEDSNGYLNRKSFEWTYAPLALILLCLITTAERVSFKMLIDRVVPFRFLVVILIVLFEAIILLFLVFFKVCAADHSDQQYQPFPRYKLLIMALLDLTKDYMMILTGCFVAPTLTVMLLQGQIPSSMFLTITSKWFRKGCCCSSSSTSSSSSNQGVEYRNIHYIGSAVICFSILLALVPVASNWLEGASNLGWNTLIYFLSCIPASASMIYKEKALTDYRQPMDPNMLNLNVDIFQLLLLIPLTPMVMKLQSLNLFSDETTAPAGTLGEGLGCFFTPHEEDAPPMFSHGKYVWPSPERAYCSSALSLLCAYVASTLLFNLAVDRVLIYGSAPLLYRSVTAAALCAYGVLGFMGHGEPTWLGVSFAWWEVPSAIFLVLGNELYHRFQEPGAEVLTQWAPPAFSV